MTEKWLEMRLAVPDEAVDLVAQVLMELGCTGTTSAEKNLDTFTVPEPGALANDPVLKAYFVFPDNLEKHRTAVRRALDNLTGIYPDLANTAIECRELPIQDWARDWQQHFPPFRIGPKLVICPSWVEWPKGDDEVVITLDPGQAFGTGTHATTGLCLDALAEHFAGPHAPARVLDVGTGSAILAMACAALGAEQVIACDIDEEACRVARENIARNHFEHKASVTDRQLEDIPGIYGLVLANILASENSRLAPALTAHVAPRGRLVLSGILIEQERQVIEAFAAYPLELLSCSHRDEWTCIVYQRHE